MRTLLYRVNLKTKMSSNLLPIIITITTRIVKISKLKNLKLIKILRCIQLFFRIKYFEYRIPTYQDTVASKTHQSRKVIKIKVLSKKGQQQQLQEIIVTLIIIIQIKMLCLPKLIIITMAQHWHILYILSVLITIHQAYRINSLMF